MPAVDGSPGVDEPGFLTCLSCVTGADDRAGEGGCVLMGGHWGHTMELQAEWNRGLGKDVTFSK